MNDQNENDVKNLNPLLEGSEGNRPAQFFGISLLILFLILFVVCVGLISQEIVKADILEIAAHAFLATSLSLAFWIINERAARFESKTLGIKLTGSAAVGVCIVGAAVLFINFGNVPEAVDTPKATIVIYDIPIDPNGFKIEEPFILKSPSESIEAVGKLTLIGGDQKIFIDYKPSALEVPSTFDIVYFDNSLSEITSKVIATASDEKLKVEEK
ncbi:MAG: hypothetical protein COC19_02930 [SAR86 cluster bacterium]|uniref:Uncharacterized protein n=1 Tax=SAR86 cluster bacterium TaxID=2030880 RepID=A0A2A4MRC3_9GAMM|nr:MAG: hypothetical protein COC19_02930 [SAR86 cluster bacterium]